MKLKLVSDLLHQGVQYRAGDMVDLEQPIYEWYVRAMLARRQNDIEADEKTGLLKWIDK